LKIVNAGDRQDALVDLVDIKHPRKVRQEQGEFSATLKAGIKLKSWKNHPDLMQAGIMG